MKNIRLDNLDDIERGAYLAGRRHALSGAELTNEHLSTICGAFLGLYIRGYKNCQENKELVEDLIEDSFR